jgi:hypothetical protein
VKPFDNFIVAPRLGSAQSTATECEDWDEEGIENDGMYPPIDNDADLESETVPSKELQFSL